jgi:hypothetical protein
MARKINISFKENERDMRLLARIIGEGDKSNFVKDCIQYWIDNNKKIKSVEKSTPIAESNYNLIDNIMDM